MQTLVILPHTSCIYTLCSSQIRNGLFPCLSTPFNKKGEGFFFSPSPPTSSLFSHSLFHYYLSYSMQSPASLRFIAMQEFCNTFMTWIWKLQVQTSGHAPAHWDLLAIVQRMEFCPTYLCTPRQVRVSSVLHLSLEEVMLSTMSLVPKLTLWPLPGSNSFHHVWTASAQFWFQLQNWNPGLTQMATSGIMFKHTACEVNHQEHCSSM